jgi:hypothetical protein
MNRLTLGAILALLASPAAPRTMGPPCVTTDFKTEMVRAACAKGGQDEAKKQMTEFTAKKAPKKTKGAPLFTCNACHTALAPKFERKPDAVDFYKALGGR